MAVPPSGREGQFKVPPSLTSDAASFEESGAVETSIDESPVVAPPAVPPDPADPPLPADPPVPGGAALSSPEHAAIRREAMQSA